MKKYTALLLAKILFLFLIAFFADKIIIYSGFFPYIESLKMLDIPKFIYSFGNFDGIQYIKIAQGGYGQWQQAYFPLYPILIHFLKPIIKNNLFAGLFISNICFLIGIYYLKKLLEIIFNKKNISWVFYFLLCFPTSFFFNVAYTEGLFFMFFTISLYFLKKEQYFLSSIVAGFSSSTRLIGIFLSLPILIKIYFEEKKYKKLFYIFLPFAGLFSYMLFLYIKYGNAFYFFTSQPAFGANRSTHLILPFQVVYRYLKIFFTAQLNFQYFVSVIEFSFFIFVISILIFDLIKILKEKKMNFFLLSINIFSFLNIILPTLTGTFSSVPRYALFSISVFLFLANLDNKFIKKTIIILFAILQSILFLLFIQGYFIS